MTASRLRHEPPESREPTGTAAARLTPRLHRPDSVPSLPAQRRAFWRQRLVDAEGGARLALRGDSTLYAHLFAASVMILTGVVLGFAFLDWVLILGAFVATLAAEVFNLALHTLAGELAPGATGAHRRALRLSTAATLLVIGGASVLSAVIIGRCLWRLFA